MKKKYFMISKMNRYIQFIFTIIQCNYYYKVTIQKGDFTKTVITNADTIEDAYTNVSDEFPSYIPISYKIIPTEYKKEYDTGKTQLLNIYERTKNGLRLIKTLEHKMLEGQTEEMVLHIYSRQYKEKYVQLLCNVKHTFKNTNSMELTKEVIDLTKRLRTDTNISMQLCKEAASKVSKENPNDSEEALFKKAKNILIAANKDKIVKSDSSGYKFFITTSKHLPSTSVMLKYGCTTEEGRNAVLKNYSKTLEEVEYLYLTNAFIYKLKNKKVENKDLYTCTDLLKMTFSTGDNEGKTVYNVLNNIQQTLGESFTLIDVQKVSVPKGIGANTTTYIHHNHKMGAHIIYDVDYTVYKEDNPLFTSHLLHQLVLNRPLCIKKNELSKSIVNHALKDISDSLIKEIKEETNIKKQENLLKRKDDIIQKRLQKFEQEVVFEEQTYQLEDEFTPKDKNTKIKDMLKERGITIFDFILI